MIFIVYLNHLFLQPQEDELREKCDTRYAHLHDDLHVEITAYAPAPDAYLRISKALFEIKRFLVPVSDTHHHLKSAFCC